MEAIGASKFAGSAPEDRILLEPYGSAAGGAPVRSHRPVDRSFRNRCAWKVTKTVCGSRMPSSAGIVWAVGGAEAAQDGIVVNTMSESVIWSGASLPLTQDSMDTLSGPISGTSPDAQISVAVTLSPSVSRLRAASLPPLAERYGDSHRPAVVALVDKGALVRLFELLSRAIGSAGLRSNGRGGRDKSSATPSEPQSFSGAPFL